MKDCPKDLSRVASKASLNVKEGTMKKGGWTPQKPVVPQPASLRHPEPKDVPKSSLLNPNPLNQWSRLESIAWMQIDGEDSWALLDNGSSINTVTSEFVDVHSLDVGPLSDLCSGTLAINGFRGVFSWPLGYVIIRVQVEGVRGYSEDQVTLVVPDSTGFGS